MIPIDSGRRLLLLALPPSWPSPVALVSARRADNTYWLEDLKRIAARP